MQGTPFGRYRLVELLGRGGMGEVWRAHDTTANNRSVAIKLLPPHLAADPTFAQRFRREADAAALLNNPHIIPIHSYGEINGRLYVDMRLIEGRDLQQVLADGPLEPARAVRIIEQVAKALHAAHKIGLVHRDVKPSNILLDDDDFAYLIDFGIARALDDTRLTGTGNAIGTFMYMAPERLGTHRDEDARADIYALACVLYECLTGRPPFAATNMASLVAAHLNEPPPQPSNAQSHVPQQFDAVVGKGMAKDPDQRYATTVELARDAHNANAPAPPSTPAPPPLARPRSAWAATQHRPLARAELPASRGRSKSKRRAHFTRAKLLITATVITVLAVTATTVILLTRSEDRNGALPFIGLNKPQGVAVDAAGNVFVADAGNDRVVKLPAGATQQIQLPISGLEIPYGLAVDAPGNVYVTDFRHNRVLKLPAGGTEKVELPFTDLSGPMGVAVDAVGTVYVTDLDRVVMLRADSRAQEVLPFNGIEYPQGIAVDAAGSVYVTSRHNDGVVVKLPAGSTQQDELPFTGLRGPIGVAVDSSGTVYVTDPYNDRVLILPVGANQQNELPLTGIRDPSWLAVDGTDNLYMVETGENQVVRMAAH